MKIFSLKNSNKNIGFEGRMIVSSYNPNPYKKNGGTSYYDEFTPYYKTVITTKEQDELLKDVFSKTIKKHNPKFVSEYNAYKLDRDQIKPVWNVISDVMKEHKLHSIRIAAAILPIYINASEDKITYNDKSHEITPFPILGMDVCIDMRSTDKIRKDIKNTIEYIYNQEYYSERTAVLLKDAENEILQKQYNEKQLIDLESGLNSCRDEQDLPF